MHLKNFFYFCIMTGSLFFLGCEDFTDSSKHDILQVDKQQNPVINPEKKPSGDSENQETNQGPSIQIKAYDPCKEHPCKEPGDEPVPDYGTTFREGFPVSGFDPRK